LDDNFTLLQKAQWFSYPFIHLHNLRTLRTTASRKSYLAEKRREKRTGKENMQITENMEDDADDDETVPVEQVPPLVSQSRAHQVGPKIISPNRKSKKNNLNAFRVSPTQKSPALAQSCTMHAAR